MIAGLPELTVFVVGGAFLISAVFFLGWALLFPEGLDD